MLKSAFQLSVVCLCSIDNYRWMLWVCLHRICTRFISVLRLYNLLIALLESGCACLLEQSGYWIITLELVRYMSLCLCYLVHCNVWEDSWHRCKARLCWRVFHSTVHQLSCITKQSNGFVWMSRRFLIDLKVKGDASV